MSERIIPVLTTERVLLTLPDEDAAGRVLDYFVRNKSYHAFTSPARPKDFYDEGYWRRRLADNQREFRDDVSMRLFLFHRDDPDGQAIGDCGLTQFVRGPLQACFLGYGLDFALEGRGYMSESLRVLLPFAFGELGFHRVMAGYLPTNERSGRLLRRLGFAVDGYARDYLYLNGEWRDHVLTALTNPDPKPPPRP